MVVQLTMKDLTRICAADVANVGQDISRLRGFVDSSYAQFALLGVQLMWTTDVQSALEQVTLWQGLVGWTGSVRTKIVRNGKLGWDVRGSARSP